MAADAAQSWRLSEFSDQHGEVEIGPIVCGVWQAFWTVGPKSWVVTRYSLRDLLDELDSRFRGQAKVRALHMTPSPLGVRSPAWCREA